MFRLIIADDEDIIRETMSIAVDYGSVGFQVVGTAKNGMEALALIEDYDPDVVITDIKMPILDGLQLIESAAKRGSRPEFIILSGYNDFEYARAAMRYGVRYYMLKPTDPDELTDVLKKIRKRLLTEKREETENNSGPIPDSKLIDFCKDYIETHLQSEELSLKWLAEKKCFVSAGYLSKRFVKEENIRFSDYLNKRRIARAKDLIIEQGETNVQDIAAQVGFSSAAQYFSQVFKKYEGITPSDFIHKSHEKL